MDPIELQNAIVEKLMTVIDPETGADVIKMQLVENISIDDAGKVTYTFRPSSPLCPIAVPLALGIIQAVSDVKGVAGQSITVIDFIQADLLNEILKSELEK
ncbi:MAG: iron-sulfur cluster assembly protein [Anaerolineaceae bacterium]